MIATYNRNDVITNAMSVTYIRNDSDIQSQ